jgi:uncharacterized protein
MIDKNILSILAKKSEAEWQKFYSKNRKKIEKMDDIVHDLHRTISLKADCLACASCCRTLGPRITDKDVDKIAKALRRKSADVVATYLRIDEDGDMVFKSMPCPFLGEDNYCSIYENRPKACREYPHTDRKRFYQIYQLSIKNAYTCPIVYEVLEELKRK